MSKYLFLTALFFISIQTNGQQIKNVHEFLRGSWKVKRIETCPIVGMTERDLQKRKKETVKFYDNKILLFEDTFYVVKYSAQNVDGNKYLMELGCDVDLSALNFHSDSISIITATTSAKYPDPPLDILVNGENILIDIDGVFFTLERVILPSKGRSIERNP